MVIELMEEGSKGRTFFQREIKGERQSERELRKMNTQSIHVAAIHLSALYSYVMSL